MDAPVAKKKLSLKDRYRAMTRDLHWDTTYQPMDKVFPYDKYEGIKIHDWDKWEDPFRLTMDAYWKYQGEKEKKLYAVIEAFAQNNGQLSVSDARYVNALKLFIQGVTPLSTTPIVALHTWAGTSPAPVRAWRRRCNRSTNCGTFRPKRMH